MSSTEQTTPHDFYVEKFVEIINGQIIGSVSGYNYSAHDPDREDKYFSWPMGSNLGNAIFVIPAGSTYSVDEAQNIITSNKIQFVRFKSPWEDKMF